MKTVSLFGSPNPQSLSSKLHSKYLNEAGLVGMQIHAYDRIVKPCIGCLHCLDKKKCVYRDMDDFYEKFLESDILTLSWPVYFSTVPGPLKNIIDRFELLWNYYRQGNKGRGKALVYFLTAGADYPEVFEPSLKIIQYIANSFHLEVLNDASCAYSGLDDLNKREMLENFIRA